MSSQQSRADWKVNLIVLSMGQFLVMSGMTMIIPFLPLYLKEMDPTIDIQDTTLWASWIFAASYITSFCFQPLWGYVSDRYGRKLMLLRSGLGMAVVITLMGFCTSAWQLLALRLLNGAVAGFAPVAISLMSANAPKEKTGMAMGVLQSANVAGTILGPIIGGLLAEMFGFRPIFYLTGVLLLLAMIVAMVLLREEHQPSASSKQKQGHVSFGESVRAVLKIKTLLALFIVSFIIQFSILATMPQLPVFVYELYGEATGLALMSGVVSAAAGITTMLLAPALGKWGDRFGAEKVVYVCLLGAAFTNLAQALCDNIWQLILIRMLLGCFIGGLLPPVYSLLRAFTLRGLESQTVSLNQSVLNAGSLLGPVAGGLCANLVSVRFVFVLCAVLFLINAIWLRTLKLHTARQAETSM
ncbi:MFS transporter [Paenibacillus sp. YYML68]|uniref:MFS transporter n=1 Tax=Paenibacillus sp. YYML68 TaxID=2909250 RepID=UPI002491140E|nr:MFS transporter [Paenibacillus sp. YYML68]